MSATGEDFTIPTVSVTVTDIVPLASGDSTGAGLALAALPLIMGGIGGAGMTVIALSMLLGGQAQARHTARTPGSARGRGGSLIDAMHDGAGQVMRTCPAPSSSCRSAGRQIPRADRTPSIARSSSRTLGSISPSTSTSVTANSPRDLLSRLAMF